MTIRSFADRGVERFFYAAQIPRRARWRLVAAVVARKLDMNDYARELADLRAQHSCIGDVRGKGLMIGVEFVKDQHTCEPDPQLRDRIVQEAFQNGLVTLGCGETAIRLSPPLCVSQQQLISGLEVLGKVIASAVG